MKRIYIISIAMIAVNSMMAQSETPDSIEGKKHSCEIDLQANDIFNRWSPTMTINHAGQDYRMRVRAMTRNLKLTFIWRFNGFKPNNDSGIDTSRFGTGK